MAAAFAAVSVLKPGASGLLPPCPFYALTGLFCPGCGTTRMLYYLVHGEVWASFRQNPLAFVALPFVIGGLINGVLPEARRARWMAWHFRSPAWTFAILVVVVTYAFLRNIPYWPACVLAPGGC